MVKPWSFYVCVGVFSCTVCVRISFSLSLLLSGCDALMRNKVLYYK